MNGRARLAAAANSVARALSNEFSWPKAFAELQNAQAIVLSYDGLNPQPPTYCYLKPYHLDIQTSDFDHIA